MTRYNKWNVELANSQLNKLTSAIKNGTEVTLNLLSNLIRNSNDETNFLHLLNNTKVSKISSKAQLAKRIQSGLFVGEFLDTLSSLQKSI